MSLRKLEEVAETNDNNKEEQKYCSNCGLLATGKFCGNCGTKQ